MIPNKHYLVLCSHKILVVFIFLSQGASLGVTDTAVTALSSAATLIGATAGSASSVHASKLQQQNNEQADDMKRLCTLYK